MKIRPYVETDFDACLEIYRENLEQGKIPDHYESEFVAALGETEILTLVVEGEEGVVGCGSVYYEGDMASANLSFGLIHPDEQQKGYGSRLLVARIGLLDTDNEGSTVTLCATEHSVGFYGRVVGFGEYARETDNYGNTFYWLYLPVSRTQILDSLQVLFDSGIELSDDIQIPIRANKTQHHKSDRAGDWGG